MLLNLTKVINKKVEEDKFEIIIPLSIDDFSEHDVISTSDINVVARIKTHDKDKFLLTVEYSCDVVFSCARCLIATEVQLSNVFERELFLKDFGNLSDNDLLLSNNSFDISKVVMEDLYLNFPVKVICSSECRGLCSMCGTNLNNGPCECDNENIDPRLIGLKDFFK